MLEIAERGRRVGRMPTPREAGWVLEPLAIHEPQEVAVILSLSVHTTYVDCTEIARGDQEHVEVPIPFGIRAAAKAGSRWCVLAHNHPSGDPRPSRADVALWHSAARQFECAGLRLMDHLVLARGGFYSCAWGAYWQVRG